MTEFFDWLDRQPSVLGTVNLVLNLLTLVFLSWVIHVVFKYSRAARDYMELAKGYSSSAFQQSKDAEMSLQRAQQETKAATALVTKQTELLGSVGPLRS